MRYSHLVRLVAVVRIVATSVGSVVDDLETVHGLVVDGKVGAIERADQLAQLLKGADLVDAWKAVA